MVFSGSHDTYAGIKSFPGDDMITLATLTKTFKTAASQEEHVLLGKLHPDHVHAELADVASQHTRFATLGGQWAATGRLQASPPQKGHQIVMNSQNPCASGPLATFSASGMGTRMTGPEKRVSKQSLATVRVPLKRMSPELRKHGG